MKKALAFLLTLCICLPMLTACDPATIFAPEPAKAPDIFVKVEKLEAGKVIDDIEITVTFDGEPVAINKIEWEQFTDSGRRYLEAGEKIPEKFSGRVNIYYYLPKGVINEDLPITVEAPGGEYDGTGDGGTADDGRLEAWTHVTYGADYDDTEAVTDPVTTETPATSAPETEADTKPAETQAHEHSWTEKESSPVVLCEQESWIKYECSVCGETKTETVPAPGHKLTDGARTEPTCKYEGSITRHCTVCGAGFIYEIPATGHDWSDYSSYNTYHERTCKSCGETEKGNHTFNPGSVTCTVCKHDIVN